MRMEQITAIEPQKTQADRVNIFVDGSFYAGAPALLVIHLQLQVGSPMTPSLKSQLATRGEEQQARDRALWLLGRYRYSQRRLQQKLTVKYGNHLAKQVAEEMVRMGLVDDRALAESLVSGWKELGGKSPLEMKAALAARGIAPDTAKEVVAQIDDEDRMQIMARLMRRRGVRAGEVIDEVTGTKIARYLAGKGFGYAEIKRAIRELGGNSEEG